MNKNDKILAILPHSIGGRLTTSSMADGFAALGFDVTIFDELSNNNFKQVFGSQNFKYILGYDYSPINLKVKNNLKVKALCYFSDVLFDPHSGENWRNLYSELGQDENLSFYWDETLCERENNPRISYLPHFVNTEIYKNLSLAPEYDIMFAGRLDTEFRLKTFLKILQNFKNVAWFAIEKHYEDALSRLDEPGKALLKKVYRGFIDNEKDMSQKINKTKLVVNFNEQGVSSLNYRTMQTYACEKLLLSDFRAEGLKYFGGDFIHYNNADELVEKIGFYLENESVCKEISERIRKIVEKDFSHRAGVQRMLHFCNDMNF